MTVEEVWLALFSDDPIYGLDEATEDLGDRIDLTEDWHAPESPTFQSLPVL